MCIGTISPGEKKREFSKGQINRIITFIPMKRRQNLLIKILIGFLIFSGILVGVTNYYLNSGKRKILQGIQQINHGVVEFDRVNLDVLRSFPWVTLKFSDIIIKDSLFSSHSEALLEAEKLHIKISLRRLIRRKIDLQGISIHNGKIGLITLEDGYNNLKSFLSNSSNTPKSSVPIRLSQSDLSLDISDTRVTLDNHKLDQRIDAYINDITSTLMINGDTLMGDTHMDLLMKELNLNKEKGPFFKDAEIAGDFSGWMNLDSQQVHINPFDLGINKQVFHTEMDFKTTGERPFLFRFENPQTMFRNTISLLNNRIQYELRNYDIRTPFHSKTKLEGWLVKGGHPLVTVDFNLKKTQIGIFEYNLDSVDMKGRFVNRIYGDTISKDQSRKHFRIEIDSAGGQYEGIHLATQKALFTKKQPDTAAFDIFLLGDGYPKQLSSLLENKKFLFNKGKFTLDLDYDGKYSGMNDVLKGSYATLQMYGFEISYAPIKVSFPVNRLTLNKSAGDSQFKILTQTFSQKNEFVIEGGLNNFPNLIFDRIPGETSSMAEISAKKLSWNDFLDLFGKKGLLKKNGERTASAKSASLKKFVSGLYDSFQPRLAIRVDTLVYSDEFEVHNFTSSVYYRDATTLVLEDTRFNYGEGNLKMSLVMDIQHPEKTPFDLCLETEKVNLKQLLPPFDYFDIAYLQNNENLPENVSLNISHQGTLLDQVGLLTNTSVGKIQFSIDEGETAKGTIIYQPDTSLLAKRGASENTINTTIQVEGQPEIISDLFNNEKFFFQGGNFSVNFSYNGDVANLEELFNTSNTHLNIKQTQVYYKPAEIVFPIEHLDLQMQRENAAFNLLLGADSMEQEIAIQGNLLQFGGLLLNREESNVSSNVEISSPHLSWDNFLTFFDNTSLESSSTQLQAQGLKKTLMGIYDTFHPILELKVDTFTYNEKLSFHNFTSRAQLDDTYTLVLDSTGLQYGKGNAKLKASFDLEDLYQTPFYMAFETQKINLGKFMDDFDYFNVSTFEKIEKMAGEVSLNGEFIGTVKDSVGLIPEDSRGKLYFLVENAQVKGFERLEDLAAKVFRRSRFENIYFSPISNTVVIRGNQIEIPQMEVQSTAFSMFVEGTFSYGDSTNMWISIPINNLKKRDDSSPPEQIGYGQAGKKIYVEVYTDKQGVDQFKLRLSKKRFYEQQGRLEEYKRDKKLNREKRKEFKQNQKKKKSPV